MNNDDFEFKMREREYFHGLKMLPGTWAVVRLDGRSFSRFTETRFDKPFDEKFRDVMIRSASAVLEELDGIYAYTESDEISVLLSPEWELFDREVEKLVSISASISTAAFALGIGEPAHFDSRIWLGTDIATVVDYFRWRQSDATRCALNGWCYWTLRNSGKTVKEATREREGQSVGFKNELLFQHGINFNELPTWQRRGTGLYWEEYEKLGFNPITQEHATAIRRRIQTDFELPMKDDYGTFIDALCRSVTNSNVRSQAGTPAPPN